MQDGGSFSRALTVLVGVVAIASSGLALAGSAESAQSRSWQLAVANPDPFARFAFAMAFDSARGRVVLYWGGDPFGGFGTLDPDTWEWDGNTWVERTGIGPSFRSGQVMAYDSQRGRVVLFGGSVPENVPPAPILYRADTWDWDGNTWLDSLPATSPSAREGAAMAYDSSRDRAVLFGGIDAAGLLGDTWEYGLIDACDHAAGIVDFAPGSGTEDASAVAALGPPDGLAVSLGLGGSLVLQIDPPVADGPGAELKVHEFGAIDGGVSENYRIDVSEDGIAYVFGADCPGDDCQLDLAPTLLPEARYVRLTDLAPDEGEVAPDAGADIDAISVFGCDLALELCNGIDDDGDGIVPPREVDHDGDGFVGCAPWSGSWWCADCCFERSRGRFAGSRVGGSVGEDAPVTGVGR